MRRSLQPASDADFAFCEALSRSNMLPYLVQRGVPWDRQRYLASWAAFENRLIVCDGHRVGVLQLLEVASALEIRDLQLLAGHRNQGTGRWAVLQAKATAAERGLEALRLRVYVENPAQALYARLGFQVEATVEGKLLLSCAVPRRGPAGSGR